MAEANYRHCWYLWQYLQPQLSNWCGNGGGKQRCSKSSTFQPGRSIDKCLFTAVLEFSWSCPHPPAQLAGCCYSLVLPAHGFSLVVAVRVRGSSGLIRYELLCLLSCWVFVLGVRLGVKGPISSCSCGPSSLQAR